ncbi:MAG: hypothetical protein IJ074_12445 [Clostridia bacterium]|nr:hypothetical protein [Clostridia bacterium]
MPQYVMLLWPHANVRYRAETLKLAMAELHIMLDGFCPEVELSAGTHLGLPCIEIASETPLQHACIERVRSHSLLYGLYQREGDLLLPIAGRESALLGEDLPGILKYKGKTNEIFTQMLLNIAWYSTEFKSPDATVCLLDPMCGRGTSLFLAVNRGWNATGSDLDKAGLREGEQFFKRYLEYHRVKHSMSRGSLTADGRGAPYTQFEFSVSDQSGALRMVNLDAAGVRKAFGAERFHCVVCDLPYGVQHASRGGSLESILKKALPAWRESLKPGGAVAVSYNAPTLPTERVREAMAQAGLEPRTGGAYDECAHWVEQAVTRDVAVGVRAAKGRR